MTVTMGMEPRDYDLSLEEDHRPYVQLKCDVCGRFVSERSAHHHFVPDNAFGPEESWIECPRCSGEEKEARIHETGGR